VANEEWSKLHGQVKVSKFIEFWLNFSKILSRPFIILKISPNSISILSVVISLPLIYNPNFWWLALISLLLDGVDGQVAISRNLSSKTGALVDSIADRTVEFIWAIAMYMLGLNIFAIGLFIGSAWVQEYMRARAGGLGFKEIGLVTIGERPTRGVFVILILLIPSFSAIILWIAVLIQIISLLSLGMRFEKEISQ
jgi:archaetidylinositol phosphate synthase